MSSSATPSASPTEDKPQSRSSTARFVLLLMLAAWAFRSLLFQPFSIPSGSMLPTLYIGDYLIVAKWPYGYSRYSFPFGLPSFEGRILSHLPERGDVVVFHHPVEDSDLIKRVVGLPGDTVAVSNGRLFLNGKEVVRQPLAPVQIAVTPNSPCRTVPPAQTQLAVRDGHAYCLYPAFLETLPNGRSFTVLDQISEGPADDVAPTRIPSGHVFLMGDNRDDSLDSRFSTDVGGIGFVPVDHLIGRALVTFWSTDGGASYLKPWTWFSALRSNRIGNSYWVRAR